MSRTADKNAQSKQLLANACELSGGVMTTVVHGFGMDSGKLQGDYYLAPILRLSDKASVRICLTPAMARDLAMQLLDRCPVRKDCGIDGRVANAGRTPGENLATPRNPLARGKRSKFGVTEQKTETPPSRPGEGAAAPVPAETRPYKTRRGHEVRNALAAEAYGWLESRPKQSIRAAAAFFGVRYHTFYKRLRTADPARFAALPQRHFSDGRAV
jgi:hypothetical protein